MIESFQQAMRSAGLETQDEILADGLLHRFRVAGDKAGTQNGWYVLHGDEMPAGQFGSFKLGISETWSSKDYSTMSDREKNRFAEKIKGAGQRRAEEEKRLRLECQEWCKKTLASAKDASIEHPYLARKKVKAYGIKQLGENLLRPLRDGAAVVHGIQFIMPDGSKKFKTGTAKHGNYFSIGRPKDNTLLICEGYATGASLHESTGYAVAVAFDAGNLQPVAKALRQKFPDIRLIVCGDNDKSGVGQEMATAAAKVVDGVVVVPAETGTDWNDIHHRDGIMAVKAQIETTIQKGHSKNQDSYTHVEDTSYSSYSSYSSTYGSCDTSLNDSILHFRDSLIISGEKPKLVQQSSAALLISKELNGRFAFNDEALTWYRYCGSHWSECHASRVDVEITKLLYSGTGEIGFSSVYARGVSDLIKKSESVSLPPRSSGTIPFQNGLLDISTMRLAPVLPENAATWSLPCSYDEKARCPYFIEWLNQAVENDHETVQLLRAWINAVLVGRPYLQIFLHLLGPGGSGKSTFVRVVFAVAGEKNCTTTSLRQLETNRFESANVFGKLVVAIEEADRYGGSVSVLKSMTGEDPLRLERKNQQQQGSFIFQGQTIITGNEHFSTNDNSSGLERRRIEIAFKRRITKEERSEWIANGGEDLLYREIPGIINWALGMSDDDVRSIFRRVPDRVRKSNLEAARANNPMIDWMLKNLIPDEKSSVQIGVKQEIRSDGEVTFKDADTRLYPNYLTFCKENGRESLSLKRFTTVLTDAAETYGVTVQKRREMDGTKIFGLKIRQDFETSWLSKLENEGSYDSMKDDMKDKYPVMQEMKDMKGCSATPIEKWEVF